MMTRNYALSKYCQSFFGMFDVGKIRAFTNLFSGYQLCWKHIEKR